MSIINRWSDCIESPENNPIYISDNVWKTASGKEIAITDMTDEHLKNCLQFVKGKSQHWESVFKKEIERRNTK